MSRNITTLPTAYLLWIVLSVCACPTALGQEATDSGSDTTWSFQPLPSMQQLSASIDTLRTDSDQRPIDLYVLRKLQAEDLAPNKRALPHRQVRRLSLMLTGLPPEPRIVDRFVEDPSDEHYARLVEHYLDSPQFGERWARHWMDVVRFAETWGYEWNHLVREAWRYRDYLIRAFNQDLPYDQLIREHIAGDLLEQPRRNTDLGINESLIGTAFYRFAETGHDDCVLYPDISLDVMDNQIDTLSKAFQALTVSCSRCHDHKLDDIPQRDYYRLLGVMASSRQVIRTLDLPHRQDELKKKLIAIKQKVRGELGELWMREAADISASRMNELLVSEQSKEIEHPFFAWRKLSKLTEEESWAEAWNNSRNSMQSEHDRRREFNRKHYTTFGDFTDAKNKNSGWAYEGLSVEDDPCFTLHGDFSIPPDRELAISSLFPAGFFSHPVSQRLNGVVRSPLLPEDKKYVSYLSMGERKSVCRTVIANCTLPYFHTNRFNSSTLKWSTVNLTHVRKSPLIPFRTYLEWATALDDQGYPVLNMPNDEYQKMLDNPRSYFGVTKVVVHDVDHPPLAELQSQLDVFESDASDLDDVANRYREILEQAIARWSAGKANESDVFWINSFIDLKLLSREQSASAKLTQLTADYRRLEQQIETPKRIVGLSDQGDRVDVPLLEGGDISAPQEVVERGYLEAIECRFPERPASCGSGRRRVADLIAHPENPLTARVMSNRIWHYLFGRGIVRSVDNFGELGDQPTHPELLDYLAQRLIDSGWSMKAVIREIVLSDAFRQSSTTTEQARQKDPENNLFHCYPSRRMEAEVIRDSLLSASGRLDLTMFGPSVNPHRAEEVDRRKLYSGPLDGDGRRSVYLKVTRMGPSKMLELFNFPDPSSTRGRRDRTNVPAQALGLMNHPFVHQQAEVSARRLLKEAGKNADFEQSLSSLFQRLFSRRPSDIEMREYAAFFKELASAHDISAWDDAVKSEATWKDLIHTLYNLKEFTYVL